MYHEGLNRVPMIFENEDAYDLWKQTMDSIRDSASLILERWSDPRNPSIEQRKMINAWLKLVKEAEDAHMTILPSILDIKDDFLVVVND